MLCLYAFDVWRFFFFSFSLFLSRAGLSLLDCGSHQSLVWLLESKMERARLQLKCEEVITPKEELISLGAGSCCF